MNDLDKFPKAFQSLNSTDIATLVKDAKSRLIYIAPAVTSGISISLVAAYQQLKDTNTEFKVVLDTDPEVYRLGYGDPKGLAFLRENNIPMNREKGIRIGCLIVDFQAWLYAPTPHLLEADRPKGIPNAVKITIEEVMPLADQILGDDTRPPEVGIEEIDVREVKTILKNLEQNPPMKFDLARKVRVFASELEYVETHLSNTQINRKTIRVPSHLFGADIDKEAQQRLKSTWKLISENSELDTRWIPQKRDKILKEYTKSLGPPFGRIIRIGRKIRFLEEIEDLQKVITDFSKNLKDNLKKELEKTQADILSLLRNRLFENLPLEVENEFANRPRKPVDLDLYILDKIHLPDPKELLEKMTLSVQFKGVTIENIQAEKFQKALTKAYPYDNWDSFFREDDAVLGEEGI